MQEREAKEQESRVRDDEFGRKKSYRCQSGQCWQTGLGKRVGRRGWQRRESEGKDRYERSLSSSMALLKLCRINCNQCQPAPGTEISSAKRMRKQLTGIWGVPPRSEATAWHPPACPTKPSVSQTHLAIIERHKCCMALRSASSLPDQRHRQEERLWWTNYTQQRMPDS